MPKVYDDADVTPTVPVAARSVDAKAGDARAYADADVTPDAPTPDSPGIGEQILSGIASTPGVLVDTAKSFGRAALTAVDLVSPISKTGGLQVPFGQLANGITSDPSDHGNAAGAYRRSLERGIGRAVSGPLAKKIADKADPSFAAREEEDKKIAGHAENLGEVTGSFIPSPINYALGQATKGLGVVGDKIGSMVRSDRRLLNQVTDGTRAKLRTKLEKTELADSAALIRNDPSLHKAVSDPAKFEQATAERLSKNRDRADAIGADVRTETHEMVKALREKQAKLRERLDTEEMADAMEKPIRKLEARAKRLDEAAGRDDATRPTTGGSFDDIGDEVSYSPAERKALQEDLRKRHGGDIPGVTDKGVDGKVTATSEQATVAPGKRGPVEPVVSEPAPPPKGEPYRAVRQYVTNRQDDAFNYMPGAKPSAKNKAHQEIADTVREVLHGKVAATAPDALPALKRLDAESSVLARMNKIAEYKHVNSPAFNTSRLTTALKNNRGAVAIAKAAARVPFRAADEALAAIARASKSGKPVPKSLFRAARDAGVKAGTINMLMTKLGRNDDKGDDGEE